VGAHAPGGGARVEKSGPDVRVEHGRLQPRAHALIGTSPSVVAKKAAMRPEIGLKPPNKRGIHVEIAQCDKPCGESRVSAERLLPSGCISAAC